LVAEKRPAEDVGKDAAQNLLFEIESKSAVDLHLADQLLPFLALSGGQIKPSKITPHALTNIYVIEKFLGKCFIVDNNIIKLSSPA